MSRSRGKLHLARICPWCGTPTLRRDYFANDGTSEQKAASGAVAFICDNCCTGFTIKDSPRAVFVNQMLARERQQRPTEDEHRAFVGSKSLTERSAFELQRIEGILRGKKPRSKASREHIERSLESVRAELKRRRLRSSSLTFKIGEIYPPGSIPRLLGEPMRISKHRRILNQITLIREAHPLMSAIFLNGACLNFFCILKSIYPEADAYYNQNHVLAKIDNKFYDISGRVFPKESDHYKPLTSWHSKRGNTRAFRQMYFTHTPVAELLDRM